MCRCVRRGATCYETRTSLPSRTDYLANEGFFRLLLGFSFPSASVSLRSPSSLAPVSLHLFLRAPMRRVANFEEHGSHFAEESGRFAGKRGGRGVRWGGNWVERRYAANSKIPFRGTGGSLSIHRYSKLTLLGTVRFFKGLLAEDSASRRNSCLRPWFLLEESKYSSRCTATRKSLFEEPKVSSKDSYRLLPRRFLFEEQKNALCCIEGSFFSRYRRITLDARLLENSHPEDIERWYADFEEFRYIRHFGRDLGPDSRKSTRIISPGNEC